MEGYYDMTVVIEGAVAEEETFVVREGLDDAYSFSDVRRSAWLDGLAADAAREGFTAEIFEQWHGHDLDDEDCACTQYETDHHPALVFTPESV